MAKTQLDFTPSAELLEKYGITILGRVAAELHAGTGD